MWFVLSAVGLLLLSILFFHRLGARAIADGAARPAVAERAPVTSRIDPSRRATRPTSQFEYWVLAWDRKSTDEALEATLNAAGAEGWEVVSMVVRATSVPVQGYGASAQSDIAIALKREINLVES